MPEYPRASEDGRYETLRIDIAQLRNQSRLTYEQIREKVTAFLAYKEDITRRGAANPRLYREEVHQWQWTDAYDTLEKAIITTAEYKTELAALEVPWLKFQRRLRLSGQNGSQGVTEAEGILRCYSILTQSRAATTRHELEAVERGVENIEPDSTVIFHIHEVFRVSVESVRNKLGKVREILTALRPLIFDELYD
ncbi:hypothetical protein Dda_5333 [Drechslerella dactyloides]|uniref:Uncharacterized protein n=1 Tax=Drechslerella dactyloides TaxID=74499 RepID=A0AAD6IY32_DREDA|nr:hypothetical protein Dda_5333 [Drechslerella dactyloides]